MSSCARLSPHPTGAPGYTADGTLGAACKLVEKAGGTVAGIAVLIDLAFLPWREKLKGYDILSLVKYDSE